MFFSVQFCALCSLSAALAVCCVLAAPLSGTAPALLPGVLVLVEMLLDDAIDTYDI